MNYATLDESDDSTAFFEPDATFSYKKKTLTSRISEDTSPNKNKI